MFLQNSKPATGPASDRPARNFQSARESIATSDGRWPPSFCAPDGFCLQSIPNRSSNRERSCENGLAERVAEFPAAAPKSTRGTATFSGLESKFPFPISSNFPAMEFFRPAPNTRARAHGADAVVFHSTSASSLKSSSPSESASSRPMG